MIAPIDTSSWLAPGAIATQDASPLYNGTVPTEIRQHIFKLVMEPETLPTVFTSHDFHVRYNHDLQPGDDSDLKDKPNSPSHVNFGTIGSATTDTDPDGISWARHDTTGLLKPMPPILALCRRIYLEITSSSSASMKRLWRRTYRAFYVQTGPPTLRGNKTGYRKRPRPKAAHLYTQMYWLAESLPIELQNSLVFSHVRDLHVSITRRDWWFNESHHPLGINPFRPAHNNLNGMDELINVSAAMSSHQGPSKSDHTPPGLEWVCHHPGFHKQSWGMAFNGSVPPLETLAITLETTEYQRDELARIVDWATTWRFPLNNEQGSKSLRYLEADPRAVERYTWRGTSYEIASRCPRCGLGWEQSRIDLVGPGDEPCAECTRVAALGRRGYGPRLYCWKVNWTAKTNDELRLSGGLKRNNLVRFTEKVEGA